MASLFLTNTYEHSGKWGCEFPLSLIFETNSMHTINFSVIVGCLVRRNESRTGLKFLLNFGVYSLVITRLMLAVPL